MSNQKGNWITASIGTIVAGTIVGIILLVLEHRSGLFEKPKPPDPIRVQIGNPPARDPIQIESNKVQASPTEYGEKETKIYAKSAFDILENKFRPLFVEMQSASLPTNSTYKSTMKKYASSIEKCSLDLLNVNTLKVEEGIIKDVNQTANIIMKISLIYDNMSQVDFDTFTNKRNENLEKMYDLISGMKPMIDRIEHQSGNTFSR